MWFSLLPNGPGTCPPACTERLCCGNAAASAVEIDQLPAQALVYRLVTEIVMRAGTPRIDMAGRAGQLVTDLLLARLGR
jgi:hypothetical protein